MGDFTRIDWNRQNGESNLWYARFLVYRNMGPERSPLASYRRYLSENGEYQKADSSKGAPGAWDRAMGKFNWRDRAEAFDAEERRTKEIKRRLYIEQLDKEAHRIAVDALKKAEKMINWPLAETKIAIDGKTHLLIPAGWNQNTAIRYLKEAHTVGLTALGVVRSGAMGAAQVLSGADKPGVEDDPIADMEWLKDFIEEDEDDTPDANEATEEREQAQEPEA